MSNATLLGPLFGTPEASAAFSDGARLQGMLDFEAALARAPSAARRDPGRRRASDRRQGQGRAVRRRGDRPRGGAGRQPGDPAGEAAHRAGRRADGRRRGTCTGARPARTPSTPALVLQLRDALALIEADLERLADALARWREAHRDTAMAGRTWLQQALPITLRPQGRGLARRASTRHRERPGGAARRGARRAVRRRGRHAGRRSASGASTVAEALAARAGARRARHALARAARPGRRSWRRRSACSPARSARSRATCRC